MRILFVTASRIGDAVLSTGLLAHLAEQYPQARFTVACGTPAAPLFAAAPFVEKVIPMVKRKRAGHWWDLWKQTCTTWWSLVVDLRGSALGYVVPTRRRAVLKSSWAPKHRLYHLSSVLGLEQAFTPVLWNTPEQTAQAEGLLPAGSPILALGPTANWGGKQWPAERFAQVAQELTAENGGRIAVFGAESEQESVHPLLAALPKDRVINLIGKVDLPTVYACLKRASLYVGNDSGLMHMAAAAGIPTLGLFGPSSEIFYGPFGRHCASIRGPRSFEEICHAPDYDYRSQACLMLDLNVETVVNAARELTTTTTFVAN
ncbi:glycosyltransferase family 9 protein [Magnetospirillum sulfuroxidans]|uniref:Glycosyltransferase family 9 protein n=1 Tax=Magnetospirillum sulfuroxidans TaxID=611300 RepID=A0ABS5IH14_9PROT|nr:glycosyltransferase family 9 protein [Magnetospirillum sulfuroxidans]MBR9973716.1 glycosyltransferase family 9 protein [Magnetospirillum sulfuroxidans]